MRITLEFGQYLDGSEQTAALDSFLGEGGWRNWPGEATDAALETSFSDAAANSYGPFSA